MDKDFVEKMDSISAWHDDYTRDEVRQALRKILGSAKRHNEREGRRGYLEFIAAYVP